MRASRTRSVQYGENNADARTEGQPPAEREHEETEIAWVANDSVKPAGDQSVFGLDRNQAAEAPPEDKHRREAKNAARCIKNNSEPANPLRRRRLGNQSDPYTPANKRRGDRATPRAAITQRLDRSSLTPEPTWPSLNIDATPSAIVTTLIAISGG